MSQRDKSGVVSSRSGWTQINVARDAHFYSGNAPAQVCDYGGGDADRPQLASQWASGLGVVLYNGWQLLRGIVLMTLLLGTSAFSLAMWAAARVANGVLMLEETLGGAPNRIISAPAKLLPLLGVGNELADIDDVKRLEPEYDHTN
jgi:hypothetical protein